MKPWVVSAFLSMVFAGITAVIAKPGLAGISWELGLFVRTLFVSAFVLGFGVLTVPARQWVHPRPAQLAVAGGLRAGDCLLVDFLLPGVEGR
jgi:uncharacterized membrane protein